MRELVVEELVVVPDPGILDVPGPHRRADLGPLRVAQLGVDRPGNELHDHQLAGSRPEVLGGMAVGTWELLLPALRRGLARQDPEHRQDEEGAARRRWEVSDGVHLASFTPFCGGEIVSLKGTPFRPR